MSFHFRRLLPHDAPAYRLIRLECLSRYPQHFGAIYADEVALPRLHMEESILSGNEEAICFGAFEEQQLVGIAALSREKAKRRRHIAHVIQVYVRDESSGRKVGFGLMQELIRYAWHPLELEQLHLEVVTSAAAAVRLYGQLGFEQCGFLHNYMKDEGTYVDAYQLVLFRPKSQE